MSHFPVEIEYNLAMEPLEEILAEVERPGDFYGFGSLLAPLPRLEIDGVGTVAFPLSAAQAKELVRAAEQAPYGRGEETIVDTAVRNVWQVALGKIRLGGKGWEETFANC